MRVIRYFICFSVILTGIWLFNHAYSEENGPEIAPGPIISKIIINILNIKENESYWREIADKLIFLKQGEPFSTEQLQNTIEALKLCKKFQEIHADSEDDADKIMLIFSLTPFQLIKDIKIEGAFPLFEREILNTMTVYTGDAFVPEVLPKQEKLIAEFFQREGFISPEVKVTSEQDPIDSYFVVHVKIKRGDYYTLKKINIQGNQAFSEKRLKLRMKIWLSSLLPGGTGRFVEENLKKDIKELTEFYKTKKYADATIKFTVDKDAKKKNATVLMTIDEGPRYDIEFKGNKEFWDFTLKKDLVLFEEGNKYDSGIKKSLKKIKDRYENAGYLEAKVTVEEISRDEKFRKLCFSIEEGHQAIVSSIRITGNHSFEEKKIKKQILTQPPSTLNKGAFVPKVLKEDIQAIQAFYLKNGYMNTQVKENIEWNEDKTRIDIGLEIEEGRETRVSSVKINGVTTLSKSEAYDAIGLKEGKPFQQFLIQNDENALAALISERGYPHVSVKNSVSVSSDQKHAEIVYTVEEGPFVEMGNIYYTGNFRTKERVIQNEVQVKPGDPFSLKKMLETQRNIRDIDTFDSVQFKAIGLKEKAEEVNLFVEMEEQKPYFIQMGAGYDTERNLFTHAKVGDHNLFGTNKDGWISGEISQIGYRAATGITEPRLFGSRISGTADFYVDQQEKLNQDFGTRTYGSSVGFNKNWFKSLGTGLNFRFERREQFERDSSGSKSDEELELRTLFVTTPSVRYDTRDSFIRPKKGIYSAFSLDISKGIEHDMDNFFKYKFDTRLYWTPLSRLTLACYGRFGYIDPFDSDGNVPEDQLFFLGGTSDVRGFSENMLRYDAKGSPRGGKKAISGSFEARFDLGMNFELTGFYDVGKIGNLLNDEEDAGGYRSSVGLGLRYITPIGPIGFLYGIKLDKEEEESYGRFHFSIGYTF